MNNVDFTNIIREEAVLFLLDLPKGEEVTILAQKKKDGEILSEMERISYRSWGPFRGIDSFKLNKLFKINKARCGRMPVTPALRSLVQEEHELKARHDRLPPKFNLV